MTTTYKVLGQALPAAATQTALYTAPALTSAVCSTLVVCNQGADATYRVAVRPTGASLTARHYIVYDAEIASSDSVFLTLGVTLAATDVVSVLSDNASTSFHLYGSEVT